MSLSFPKPSPAHILRNSVCLFVIALSSVPAGTQTASAPAQDDKGIASKSSAQAFQTGATQAAKGAEPGQPTAPKPDTALSILVLPNPLPAEITSGIDVDGRSKAILAHLSEVLRFYRMNVTPVQKVGEPSDVIYAQQTQAQSTQAAQLAFQAARDEAALLARIPSKNGNSQQPDSERTQRLNQVRARAAQRIQDLQQQSQNLQQQLAKARGTQRIALQQQLARGHAGGEILAPKPRAQLAARPVSRPDASTNRRRRRSAPRVRPASTRSRDGIQAGACLEDVQRPACFTRALNAQRAVNVAVQQVSGSCRRG